MVLCDKDATWAMSRILFFLFSRYYTFSSKNIAKRCFFKVKLIGNELVWTNVCSDKAQFDAI